MSEREESFDAKRVKELGWRQGSILPRELVTDLLGSGSLPDTVDPTDLLILVSHNCDITHGSLANEPFTELLQARPLAEGDVDGSLVHGKNPRRLHFPLTIDGRGVVAEAKAYERVAVCRTGLMAQGPDASRLCDERTVDEIISWLTKRYDRTAFPDAFDARRKSAGKRITRALKQHGHHIREIFVTLSSWDELPSDVPYKIQLIATMDVDDYHNPTKRYDAQQALDVMEEKLQGCKGIGVTDAILASEAEISLDDLRPMARIDFDYLSVEDGPSA